MKSKGMGGSLHEMVSLKRANPNLDCPIIMEQLKQDGIGSYLCSEAMNNDGDVRTSAFIRYCFIQENAMRLIAYLCQNFGYVEMMEHCGDYFKLRIPTNDTSIGFIFSRLMATKEEYQIAEYGVAQTSLDQIFKMLSEGNLNSKQKAPWLFRLTQQGQLNLENPNGESVNHLKQTSGVRKSQTNLRITAHSSMLGVSDQSNSQIDSNANSNLLIDPAENTASPGGFAEDD